MIWTMPTSAMTALTGPLVIGLVVGLAYVLLPYLGRYIAKSIGKTVRARTQTRRELLFKRATDDERAHPATSSKDRLAKGSFSGKPAHEWEGVVAFFHPFWYP